MHAPTKVTYEKNDIRVVVTEWPHDREPSTFVVDVEQADGKDALGVKRWGAVEERIARTLAEALAGEQRNCSKLAQAQHVAKMDLDTATVRIKHLEAALADAIDRRETDVRTKGIETPKGLSYDPGQDKTLRRWQETLGLDPDDQDEPCPEDDNLEGGQ